MGTTVGEWIARAPVIRDVIEKNEVLWLNEGVLPFEKAMHSSELGREDVADASRRLSRFAAYFKKVFPETKKDGGLLESPLARISKMQAALDKKYGEAIPGELLIKLDSHLAVSGSIKARGGIYEVLYVAEQIAMKEGGLTEADDYAVLADEKYKKIFSKYSIAVGSTGNLGLSIGIISAALGFRVTVHMSADARAWKKALLRAHGVTVKEYESDYSVAVENGRRAAQGDPFCHFVDDENSRTLFLGYAVAAERLKAQLDALGIEISKQMPLYVYLPCGVGGGPGGVAFGLKLLFGDNVHCFFAEPTESCCMMLGLATGLHNAVSVADFGVGNRTIADGLAVGRASGFVGRQMLPFMDGSYSVSDERMSALLKMLADEEGIKLEPSALAGMFGPVMLAKKLGALPRGYHLVWATGGGMVPAEEYEKYYNEGAAACKRF
ncbi:MAG: D-serine ammonia-lyase [Clostridia bacterium]|nr:D-serine ammonia-lyase [Clostridia bacterium]